MPKLILSMDGLVLKELVLTKERTTIGRKPDNDIQIDNLAISGHHAAIVCILDDAFLEDLNSTNGTYVNGQQVKKQVIKNHDVIEVGKYRLKFLVESEAERKASIDLIDTDLLGQTQTPEAGGQANTELPHDATQLFSGNALSQLADDAADVDVPPVRESRGFIRVLSGSNAGKELALTKSMTTLGKPGVQVSVITKRSQGYFITHVEGATFPLVNGKMLDAQAHLLRSSDIIDIAGIKMEFYVEP